MPIVWKIYTSISRPFYSISTGMNYLLSVFLFSFLQLAIKNASDNNDKWNDKKKKKKKTQCRTLAYLPIQKKWIKDIRLKYGHVGEIHLAEWECRSSSKESKETGKKRDGGEEEPFETIQKKKCCPTAANATDLMEWPEKCCWCSQTTTPFSSVQLITTAI